MPWVLPQATGIVPPSHRARPSAGKTMGTPVSSHFVTLGSIETACTSPPLTRRTHQHKQPGTVVQCVPRTAGLTAPARAATSGREHPGADLRCNTRAAWRTSSLQGSTAGRLRSAPFCIGVGGGTASGKTTVCQQIMQARSRGQPTLPSCAVRWSRGRPQPAAG